MKIFYAGNLGIPDEEYLIHDSGGARLISYHAIINKIAGMDKDFKIIVDLVTKEKKNENILRG